MKLSPLYLVLVSAFIVLHVLTEKKAEFFFTLYDFVVKPTSVQRI